LHLKLLHQFEGRLVFLLESVEFLINLHHKAVLRLMSLGLNNGFAVNHHGPSLRPNFLKTSVLDRHP
jgi:hypothetical protein